jgi:adenylate cyclase
LSAGRRLVAVLAADIVGYSRLMSVYEDDTMAAWWTFRREVIDPAIENFGGRIVKHTGDGFLAEFPSAFDAVRCALGIQSELAERNSDIDPDRRVDFRMGINLGDVMSDDEDIYGDGVNMAARIEALAEPGGVSISTSVRDQIKSKPEFVLRSTGEHQVKNIAEPVRIYTVSYAGMGSAGTPPAKSALRRRLLPVAILAVLVLTIGGLLQFAGFDFNGSMSDRKKATDFVSAIDEAKPSIAVLPFDNLSNDPDQAYFADGMSEDIITDLSQVSGLVVIARNSSFAFRGEKFDIRDVAAKLGVRYVLEGSVRKAGGRVRINAQLIDAQRGGHVWAERYDRKLDDIFALQDEVTARIVKSLAITLTEDEADRRDQRQISNPEAYDALLRGLGIMRRFSVGSSAAARKYFAEAIALDPAYARAHGNMGLTHAMDVMLGLSTTPDLDLREADLHIKRALALDKNVPQVYFARSVESLWAKSMDVSLESGRTAVALDPNYADGYAAIAMTLNYLGRPQEAREALMHAMRLNPLFSFYYVFMDALSAFQLRDYDGAAALAREVLQRNPHFSQARNLLAATYAHMGRVEDAAWEITELMMLAPGLTLDSERRRLPFTRADDLEHYLDGLTRAGLKAR